MPDAPEILPRVTAGSTNTQLALPGDCHQAGVFGAWLTGAVSHGSVQAMNDFFVSYNRADRQWAEWIAFELEESGYTTVLQAWDFRPGTSFVEAMDRATRETERTVAVLSPDYLASNFTTPEWEDAFRRDPTGREGTLLPVRVRETERTGLMARLVYVDLVNLDEEAARTTLLAGVGRDRAKPSRRPLFPGAAALLPSERSVSDHPGFPGGGPSTRLAGGQWFAPQPGQASPTRLSLEKIIEGA